MNCCLLNEGFAAMSQRKRNTTNYLAENCSMLKFICPSPYSIRLKEGYSIRLKRRVLSIANDRPGKSLNHVCGVSGSSTM